MGKFKNFHYDWGVKSNLPPDDSDYVLNLCKTSVSGEIIESLILISLNLEKFFLIGIFVLQNQEWWAIIYIINTQKHRTIGEITFDTN